MQEKVKNMLLVGLVAAVFFGLAVWSWVKPATEYSYSERRHLEQMPELSFQTFFGEKSFMEKFESYTTDQFPLRETFRGLNALVNRYALGQKLSNDIYIVDGYEAALEYTIDESSVDWALRCFSNLAVKYLKNSQVYFTIVPDKGYFVAEENGYPALDYAAFFNAYREGTADYATFVDITGELNIGDYYKTDTHWRQEALPEVAATLLQAMGAPIPEGNYETVLANDTFYGVYVGQAALPVDGEPLYYLTNDVLDGLQISCWDTGKDEPLPLYDLELATGKDGYEMFLSGSKALLTIDNPAAETDRTLVIFRDSFGSSLAPLLSQSYRKVTVVDIRYFSPAFLDQWVEFDGADVLFLYSTSVLNTAQDQLLQ